MKRPFVYLVRKRALGDVLWIEPVIRALAARNKKVIVFTTVNELFANYPLSNVVFRNKLSIFEKVCRTIESFCRSAVFFINLDNAYEEKPREHFLQAYQEKAGLPLTREYPKLYLNSTEEKRPPLPEGKYAVLHLESMSSKNYRKVYGVDWEQVANHIKQKGITLYQIGNSPPSIPGVVHIKSSIREMIRLIRHSSFFIGLDSGPSHIAASLGIPSLIFFGAVKPELRHFPELFKGFFLQQYCEFAGCYHEVKNNQSGPDCKLVGNEGIPKCSLHTSGYAMEHIDRLITEYSLI
ncbi:glycosyltransferase family 9 protein [Pseudoflavitalea rhizosphaerae]|uniref:glycosyltransferase family 9 protein n=1 Tax=Pseudoflavitalea rhizosphaerae TaxID=1884793 RepID=UPI000F8ED8CE|nr:lipopolysaccharide heptosyltransferase family protein [Pseudoflavitalea rhizosphaerae]